MAGSIELASDVVTGGTALGGLLLVYIGGVTASYSGFQKAEQGPVRAKHQTKAWLAVIGLFFSLGSAGAAVVGKWLDNECAATAAIISLIVALLWGCLAAILSAKEIH
jgi:hypothetical protein